MSFDGKEKIILFKFFKRAKLFVFGKIGLLVSFFFFSFFFFFLVLLLPIGNFCCWANILDLYIYFF